MNKKTTTLMVALVGALVVLGIVPVPAGAVSADCDHNFDIPKGEPPLPRDLPEDTNEVGKIEVTGQSNVTVRVKLETVGIIAFGVFVMDPGCTEVSSGSSPDCDDHQEVETESIFDQQFEDCELVPGKTYFFNVVNDDDVDHDYKIWER